MEKDSHVVSAGAMRARYESAGGAGAAAAASGALGGGMSSAFSAASSEKVSEPMFVFGETRARMGAPDARREAGAFDVSAEDAVVA